MLLNPALATSGDLLVTTAFVEQTSALVPLPFWTLFFVPKTPFVVPFTGNVSKGSLPKSSERGECTAPGPNCARKSPLDELSLNDPLDKPLAGCEGVLVTPCPKESACDAAIFNSCTGPPIMFWPGGKATPLSLL